GDRLHRRFWNGVALDVHLVRLDLLGADGAEGGEADVEGDPGEVDPLLPQAVEEGGREVEAGGGRGGGAGVAGGDGLVAAPSPPGVRGVGREGGFTTPVQPRVCGLGRGGGAGRAGPPA